MPLNFLLIAYKWADDVDVQLNYTVIHQSNIPDHFINIPLAWKIQHEFFFCIYWNPLRNGCRTEDKMEFLLAYINVSTMCSKWPFWTDTNTHTHVNRSAWWHFSLVRQFMNGIPFIDMKFVQAWNNWSNSSTLDLDNFRPFCPMQTNEKH